MLLIKLLQPLRRRRDGHREIDNQGQVNHADPFAARAKDPALEVQRVILVFHKPYGVLSQYKPVAGKRSLLEFPELSGGKAVGRLDEDSEGLLVISDQAWVQTLLTRPGQIEKIYHAQVERIPDPAAMQRLCQGVNCGDFVSAPARARLLPELRMPEREPPIRQRLSVPTIWLELQLREGKNRQVRRMTAAVGHPTLRLLRVGVGMLQLAELGPGKSRHLTRAEEEWLTRVRKSRVD